MDFPEVQEFKCAMCGNCCRGDGYVRVTPKDIKRMAEYLGITETDFIATYTKTPEIPSHAEAGDLWVIEKDVPERDCIFLENNRCVVHPVKPVQCIGFPMKWRTPDIMDYCVGMQS